MTQDEIIEMARQAGFGIGLDDPIIYAAHERFAKLVAQHEREACMELTDSRCQCGGLIQSRGQA
jgi:hypothetical protein